MFVNVLWLIVVVLVVLGFRWFDVCFVFMLFFGFVLSWIVVIM